MKILIYGALLLLALAAFRWLAFSLILIGILMLIWGALFYVLHASGMTEIFFLKMCQGGLLVNVVMFAFNLFPLPPLDGGRIVVGLLPLKQAMAFSRIEPYGFFVVMALVVTGLVSSLWMQPVMALTFGFVDLLLSPLSALVR